MQTEQAKRTPKGLVKVTMWVLLSFGSGIVSFLMLSPYMRLIYDDFCQSAEAQQKGAIMAVLDTYQVWSGRFSAYYFASVSWLIGNWTIMVIPILLIIGYLLVFFFLFRQLATHFGIKFPALIAVHLSILVTFIWLNITGFQPTFWLAGVASYGAPVLIGLGFSTWLMYGIRQGWRGVRLMIAMLMSLIIMLITAGFSELYIVMQAITILLFVAVSLSYLASNQRRSALVILLAAAVGLIIGGYLVISAPGNAIRLEAAPGLHGTPLLTLIEIILQATLFLTFGDGFRFAGIFTCYMAVLALLLWWYRSDSQTLADGFPDVSFGRAFWSINVIAVIWLIVSVALPMYGVGVLAPRVTLFAHLIHLLWMVALAYLSAVYLVRTNYVRRLHRSPLFKYVALSIFALMIFYPISTVIRHIRLLDSFSSYAQSWDARDAFIRTQIDEGKKVIYAEPLAYDIEDAFALDKAGKGSLGVNQCMAQYYSIDKLIVNKDE